MPAGTSAESASKTWVNFSFENCVTLVHEGLPGDPDKYRIKVKMDAGYKLTDLSCDWKTIGASRILRLSAVAKDSRKAAVKANKSFEILVDPRCQLMGDATPTVTKQSEECWVEFPVEKLPDKLPRAS